MPHQFWKSFIGCLSRTGFISKYFCLCLSVSITLVHLILLQCSLFILLLASAYDLQKTPPGYRNTKCILELSYLLLTDHFTSLHQNCGIFSLLHSVHLVLWLCLTGGNWQKWKRVFLTCPCHEIYRDEAVGLKSCNNTWKITIFVKMWNLGQYRENLIFCQ